MEYLNDKDFRSFYNETLLPIVSSFEGSRKHLFIGNIAFVVAIFISLYLIGGILLRNGHFDWALGCIPFCIVIIVSDICAAKHQLIDLRDDIKKQLISQIFAFAGELYFCSKENAVQKEEIKNLGLFPAFTAKSDDDVIVGIHNECKFLINECKLSYSLADGVNISDFSGLLIKIIMNKNFSGQTILGPKDKIVKNNRFEEISLESMDFMKNRKIYSTDQIEARYILTPSFMERLDNLAKIFGQDISKKNNISAIFTEGFVYLFVPSRKDFFEVSLYRTLLDYNKYYEIYKEIISILDVIDCLQLNKNIGL